jgi:hypothetical protein
MERRRERKMSFKIRQNGDNLKEYTCNKTTLGMLKKLIIILAFTIGVSSIFLFSIAQTKPATPKSNVDQKIIIPIAPLAATSSLPVYTVGHVSRHVLPFVNQKVRLQAYLLEKDTNYIIVSDEPSGSLSRYDLPVEGKGIDVLQPGYLYIIEGVILDHGLHASNGNPYHLELSQLPILDAKSKP